MCRFLNVATGLCAVLCAISYGMALAVYQPITVSKAFLSRHAAQLLGECKVVAAWSCLYEGCDVPACLCCKHNGDLNGNLNLHLHNTQNAEGLLDQALRVFGLLGAVLVAVIEIEWERLLQLVRFTEYWVGRAVVQVRHQKKGMKLT